MMLSPSENREIIWIDETEIPGIRTMRDIRLKYNGEVYADPTVMGVGFIHP